jgi:hypothetical protein
LTLVFDFSWRGGDGVLQGVLRILRCFVVVNHGEIRGECMVKRGELTTHFSGLKIFHFFEIYFWVLF